MIRFLYNHFNKLSKRNRIVIITAVAVIFIIVYGCSVWNQFFADTLVRYVPDNTQAYLHLNLSSTQMVAGFDSLTRQALADFNVSEIDMKQIKREVAVICLPSGGGTVCGVIIRTNSPDELEIFLKSRQAKYRAVDFWHNRWAVYSDDAWLAALSKQKTTLAKAIQKQSPWRNNFLFYVSPEIIKNYAQSSLLALMAKQSATNGEKIVLTGRLSHGGLAFGNPQWQLIQKNNSLTGDYELVLTTDNLGKFFSAWENNLIVSSSEQNGSWQEFKQFLAGNYALSFDSQLAKKFFTSQITLVAKKNTATSTSDNIFLAGHAWSIGLKMPTPLTSDEKGQLENTLRFLMANQYPKAKKVALNDGSYVTEFKPDIGGFKFVSDKNVNSLVSPDGVFKIYYKTEGNNLYISNDSTMLNQSINLIGNYLKLGTGTLNFDQKIAGYLNNFSLIVADDKGLVVF
ncbi:MAG: hypothetical protein WC516_03055 [Patescibacteria group bacterium]